MTTTGGFREIELGFQVRQKPEEATPVIIQAYKDAHYNGLKAAEALGVTYRTFWRYVEHLGIHGQLEALQAKAKDEGLIPQVRRRTKAKTTKKRKKGLRP